MQPLHFEPGSKHSYTGVAYTVLSLIVEQVSGMPYEQFTRQHVLEPIGIRTSMRVGRTLLEGQSRPDDPALHETRYYVPTGYPAASSVFPFIQGAVYAPYGQWYNETLGASGGWLANAPALLRLVHAMEGRNTDPFFSPATIAAIKAKPSFTAPGANSWIGLGWGITEVPSGTRWSFSGAIRGTRAVVVMLPNSISYAAIVNTSDEGGTLPPLTQVVPSRLLAEVGPVPVPGTDLFTSSTFTDGPADAPQILSQLGVVQGASFLPGITGGSWFSIFGWNLANTTRLWQGSDFTGNQLPTSLDGVRVLINGEEAAVYFISPGQINAQAKNLDLTGIATVQVVRDGIASDPEPVEYRERSPEFFRYSFAGKSYVAAIDPSDGVTIGDPALLGGVRAAAVDQFVSIFGTGLTTSPDGVIISQGDTVPGTTVTVGGVTAEVQFSGLVGAGLFQVNIKVPDLPPGDYEVVLSVDGVASLSVGVLVIR